MTAQRRWALALAMATGLGTGPGAESSAPVPRAPCEASRPASSDAKPIRLAVVCFLTGERVSGLNKICYYDCLGSEAAITINAVAPCPLSINR